MEELKNRSVTYWCSRNLISVMMYLAYTGNQVTYEEVSEEAYRRYLLEFFKQFKRAL